jgi:hypothetical protein
MYTAAALSFKRKIVGHNESNSCNMWNFGTMSGYGKKFISVILLDVVLSLLFCYEAN